MQRRHFVLLEILIAFALVSASILPFLRYPFADMRREIDFLYAMELEKLAQNELADLQVRLYKKEISPNSLFTEKETVQIAHFEKIKVEPCPGWSKHFLKSVTIKNDRQKETPDKIKTAVLSLEVKYFEVKNRTKVIASASSDIVIQKKGAGK